MYDQQLYKVLKDYIKPKVLKKNIWKISQKKRNSNYEKEIK